MHGSRFISALRIVAIAAGIFALLWHPSALWIERSYANGGYPQWQHLIQAISAPLPWSLGDIAALSGIVFAVARVVANLRRRRRPAPRRLAAALIDLAAIAGAYALWFEASWAWNYNRAPLETRLAYQPSNVNAARVESLRARAISRVNELVAPAHAEMNDSFDLLSLEASWLPAVQAAGDRWSPLVGAAKPTIADPFMAATGTSGFINPLTLNVQLASDLLWFERPFSLAHEWSHVAAYAREDEANYLAIVTCLRSPDPAVQYSGWLELFLYLPPKVKYRHSEFRPLVWRDFAALRDRNARRVNRSLSRWSWRTYNSYLKSNHVAAGVQNYNEVTRLVLGIPLDRNGLPVAKTPLK